ncbi:hypothetical protein ACQPXH_22330 [Nocardia sp. CA-135953]|uniref:hypothetical protein n=1 Tax=Nocardia sp. CA-135953 TaxID=3239978 RepID=UPI003D9825CF
MSPDTDTCQQYTPQRSTPADPDDRRPKAIRLERTNGPERVIETRCHTERLDCRHLVDPQPPAASGPDTQTLLDVLTDPSADAAALAARLTPTAAPREARQR